MLPYSKTNFFEIHFEGKRKEGKNKVLREGGRKVWQKEGRVKKEKIILRRRVKKQESLAVGRKEGRLEVGRED